MQKIDTAVILAGGFGTRLSEETRTIPKPMVTIGGIPILMHIIRHFYHFDVRNFIICCGYKQEVVKDYFQNFFALNSDIEVNLNDGSIEYLSKPKLDVKVSLIDTGLNTMTGGRLKKIYPLVKEHENVFVTYGDGLADIDLNEQTQFHLSHGKKATVAAVFPEARFGALEIRDDLVTSFLEKPLSESGRINGGFFILNSSVLNEYIGTGDDVVWEQGPLEQLARDGELMAFKHNGFWRPMDTLRDKTALEEMWTKDNAPWRY